jgi:hypothetical protein
VLQLLARSLVRSADPLLLSSSRTYLVLPFISPLSVALLSWFDPSSNRRGPGSPARGLGFQAASLWEYSASFLVGFLKVRKLEADATSPRIITVLFLSQARTELEAPLSGIFGFAVESLLSGVFFV